MFFTTQSHILLIISSKFLAFECCIWQFKVLKILCLLMSRKVTHTKDFTRWFDLKVAKSWKLFWFTKNLSMFYTSTYSIRYICCTMFDILWHSSKLQFTLVKRLMLKFEYDFLIESNSSVNVQFLRDLALKSHWVNPLPSYTQQLSFIKMKFGLIFFIGRWQK